MNKKIYFVIITIFIAGAVLFSLKTKNVKTEVKAQSQSADWPQVQHDAQRSGYVPQTLVPPYTELWRIQKFPVSSRVQPIIAEGRVYVPSNDGNLYSINTADGSTAWSTNIGSPFFNSAAYANGLVFASALNGTIYAFNSQTGEIVWQFQTNGSIKGAPLLAGSLIYVGSSDGKMYALSQADGTLTWSTDIGAPIYDTPAYNNGKIFFGGMDSVAYGMDAISGQILWSTPIIGQGFYDRWTVADNTDNVYFVPILNMDYHTAIGDGTFLFRADNPNTVYNQPWSVQRQAILDLLAAKPSQQPLYVLSQSTGQSKFTPPVLYTNAMQEPHSEVVLLPNGNVNVVYRRSFGEEGLWGATTNTNLYTGELTASGDIIPVGTCDQSGTGWAGCGNYQAPFTSDEPSGILRTGEVLYALAGRGIVGLDTKNSTNLQTLACFNPTSGGPFCDSSPITFTDYDLENTNNGWRFSYPGQEGATGSYQVAVVNNTFYILSNSTLIAAQGTIR